MTASRHTLVNAGAILVGLIVLAFAGQASAAPSAKADLARAVEQFRQAMVKGDGKTLSSLASPNLTFGHSNGMVQSREEFVGTVVTKKEVFRSIKLSNHKNTVVGSTAIARHIFDADILLEGKPLKVKLECLEVWQKDATGWKLVARQAFKTK